MVRPRFLPWSHALISIMSNLSPANPGKPCPPPPPTPKVKVNCHYVYFAKWDCSQGKIVGGPGVGYGYSHLDYLRGGIPGPGAAAKCGDANIYPDNEWIIPPGLDFLRPTPKNGFTCTLWYYQDVERELPDGSTCVDCPPPRDHKTYPKDWPHKLVNNVPVDWWPQKVQNPQLFGMGGEAEKAGCKCPKKIVFQPCVNCDGEQWYPKSYINGAPQRQDPIIHLNTTLDILGSLRWKVVKYKWRGEWRCWVARAPNELELSSSTVLWFNLDPASFYDTNVDPSGLWYDTSDSAKWEIQCWTCMHGHTFRSWDCDDPAIPAGGKSMPPGAGVPWWNKMNSNLPTFSGPEATNPSNIFINNLINNRNIAYWVGPYAGKNIYDFVKLKLLLAGGAGQGTQGAGAARFIYKVHQQPALPAFPDVGNCGVVEYILCPSKYEQVLAHRLQSDMIGFLQPGAMGAGAGPWKHDYFSCDLACPPPLPPPPTLPPPRPPPPPVPDDCKYKHPTIVRSPGDKGDHIAGAYIWDPRGGRVFSSTGTGHCGSFFYGNRAKARHSTNAPTLKGWLGNTCTAEGKWPATHGKTYDQIEIYCEVKNGQMPDGADSTKCDFKTYYEWQFKGEGKANATGSLSARKWERISSGSFDPNPTQRSNATYLGVVGKHHLEPLNRTGAYPLGKIYPGFYRLKVWRRGRRASAAISNPFRVYNSVQQRRRWPRLPADTEVWVTAFRRNWYGPNEMPVVCWSDVEPPDEWLDPDPDTWICIEKLSAGGQGPNKHYGSWDKRGKNMCHYVGVTEGTYGQDVYNTPLNSLTPLGSAHYSDFNDGYWTSILNTEDKNYRTEGTYGGCKRCHKQSDNYDDGCKAARPIRNDC